MRYTITGRNIEITDGLKKAVEEKLHKLGKYFTEDTEAKITLSVQKEAHKIEVTIPTKQGLIRAEEVSEDMYVSIDKVEDIIERQIKKFKNKLVDRKQSGVSFSELFINEEDSDVEEEDEIKIVKTKRFSIKPMDPEEACLQMELLAHDFYVFRNAISDEICVVYKRKDGKYGIIEPEV
ncbi:ribosomal subunit interface protein [Lachnoanaerobaculum saburreum F0468]|jgi:ribosomal subunit interface protein|uniref:Ribosome hibernation promoting factor n=2 Tax=Lachnoanaerobaculum saburreum TaxID=467210 RepID=I0R9G5_9FIRM|nr:ribosome-associated translation inhibitor RaiA [Lachnoanaerobaculum saburreum]EFU75319.1 ribosomal subunit interface protein [Lachnoanaerobaculum saburreum DSM 3986]EIC96323.1 ribosomal subunit interface protein [Lachnoanaerobaculum saburreum F0468]RKW42750.1 MAG: ribosome-associated translation inhibitor RaiA [Lachnospiraceae bacterium]